jgi:hypothetical protein
VFVGKIQKFAMQPLQYRYSSSVTQTVSQFM